MKNNSKDRFIEIAAGGKKLTGDVKRLPEIPPLVFKHHLLDKTNAFVSPRKEVGEDELYNAFLSEKEELKARLIPFLSKYSENIKVDKKELKRFAYKKLDNNDYKNFNDVILGNGNWKQIKVPHYVGIQGVWSSAYRTELDISHIDTNKEYILQFESVDYECDVYLNGSLVTKHVGFFAPFEADITDYLIVGKNILLLVVKNDITTTGVDVNGKISYGKKIYGATNIGYNEPNLGWHHCPAGIGVIGRIYLVKASKQRIADVFVLSNIDNGTVKIKTTIRNYEQSFKKYKIIYKVEPRNFVSKDIVEKEGKIDDIQYGANYVEEHIALNNFRLWDLNTPYLYDLTVKLLDKNKVIDKYQIHFGMRKFIMDLNSKPLRGAFYFNNKRIMLRGTNEMGHLPRAVMENKFDVLVDDIITAKVAGLNYYRITQRPTLNVIYSYFDMLGMLCQSDFPLFSYLPEAALPEAYKQIDEMERLTRNHPSVIIESFCNETLDKTAWGKEQYVLSRFEIEKFFDIALKIVELLNPDRVIKYSEGDYAPLEQTYGISDFHCYTYWYISHGLPSGKLRKGYLPPIRKDYMCGCGEFGVDGLDSYDIMSKYAPKSWLPRKRNDYWTPKVIAKSQCYQLHGDFFPEEDNIDGWIKASREYQKRAIREYVKSLRLRSDYLQSTAVHLLIDAWPMGWTKALIDVDRKPKPAFYTFKEETAPLKACLRRDKYVIYASDLAPVEIYAFNDLPKDKPVKGVVSIHYNKDNVDSYSFSGIAKAVSASYLGEINIEPKNKYLGEIKVCVEMDFGDCKSYDELTLVSKKDNKAIYLPIIHGKEFGGLVELCDNNLNQNIIFCGEEYYLNHKTEIDKEVFLGKTLFLNIDKPLKVANRYINFKTHTLEEEVRANNLIYPSNTSTYSREFNNFDFQNFFNKKKDYQDLTNWFKFYDDEMEEILYTLEDIDGGYKKKHKIVLGKFRYGEGSIYVSTLSIIDGGLGVNPTLDKLFINIINDAKKGE